MKVHLPIVRSDRGRVEQSSSFLVKSNRSCLKNKSGRLNGFGEYDVYARGNRYSKIKYHETEYWNVFCDSMMKQFISDSNLSNEMTWITFRYSDGDSLVILRREGSKLMMNGVQKNQKDVALALAKIISFGAENRSADAMDNYIDRNTMYSANVLYALQNRMPYWIMQDGRRVNVKINVKLISREKVAFEIGPNIWASLDVKEANTFIDCYRNDTKRSRKWAAISPSNLWFNMFNAHASESEREQMIAWFLQNRTEDIVDKRAFELLQSLDARYKEITLIDLRKGEWSSYDISTALPYAMHVRGELSDWIVYGNGKKQGTQRCSVVDIISSTERGTAYCIDDVNGKNVVGDQMATRAMLVKNDKQAKTLVRTLQGIEYRAYRTPTKDIKNTKYTGEYK